MKPRRPVPLVALTCAVLLLFSGVAARAHIRMAYSLARVIQESSNVVLMQVDKVDKQNNTIVYRKIKDLKGNHPGQAINHIIGKAGYSPFEWQSVMEWAEVGKMAVWFHNGGGSETCIDKYWYQALAGEWWRMNHSDPYLCRTFSGRPEKLAEAITAMLAGQEVVIPCLQDGDLPALYERRAKTLRIKASMKLMDYNQPRDFVGWGTEEFTAVQGMPGFTHYAGLPRVDPNALGIATADFNGDGKVDCCLYGASRVVLLQNNGGLFADVPLPISGGARSASWGDFDGDGKLDLLLATPSGPKLLKNEGDKFRDVSSGLPLQGYYNLKGAAWIDHNRDGRPDIVLADAFTGLRLYLNRKTDDSKPATFKLGKWSFAGPFENANWNGFETAFEPENGVNLSQQYTGKNGSKVAWKEGKFNEGAVNSLALFKPELNDYSAVYVYREIESGGSIDIPVSLGSDDSLTVWLNGTKIHSENIQRGCEPDQVKLNLSLKPGKNTLLLKVCNGTGDFAFYFSMAKPAEPVVPRLFDDVSDNVGLGINGPGGNLRGHHVLVADVNGDGRPDLLYGAGAGLLLINTPGGFVEVKNSGISYQPEKGTPVFGDFDGDGYPDLFVPQPGKCKLFRNSGKGMFVDVAEKAGVVIDPSSLPTCAVWTDFNNRGCLDLMIGCLKGPNVYLRNEKGVFVDAGDQLGLSRNVYNTRGIAAIDVNNDGVLDLVMNNEGRESAVLLGRKSRLAQNR